MRKKFEYNEPLIFEICNKDYIINYANSAVIKSIDSIRETLSKDNDLFEMAEDVCMSFIDSVTYSGAYLEIYSNIHDLRTMVRLMNSIIEAIDEELEKASDEYTS